MTSRELLERRERRSASIFGHTICRSGATAGGIELINPGSVGMPFDGDSGRPMRWCMTTGRSSTGAVAYDHEASAARVRSFDAPWAEVVAERILRARANV